MNQPIAYGIDFGTTNSTVVAIDSEGNRTQLPIDAGAKDPNIMRSAIFVDSNNTYRFGSAAIDSYITSIALNAGKKTKKIYTGKYIKLASAPSARSGFKPDEIVPEVIEVDESQTGRLLKSIKSLLGSNTVASIRLNDEIMPIEQLIGIFLKELKTRADYLTGTNVKQAIVGRPIEYVGGNNKLAVKRMYQALSYAGLESTKLEYEPIGAAYDYSHGNNQDQTILVFDFGGGTLDISIVRIGTNQILSRVGLALGGDDFNSKLFSHYAAPFFGSLTTYSEKNLSLPRYIFNYLQDWYQISLLKKESFFNSLEKFQHQSSDKNSILALESLVENNLGLSVYEEIEKAKIHLTDHNQTKMIFKHHNINLNSNILRDTFEILIRNDVNNINTALKKAVKSANISTTDIDVVVTTGGSSLIPKVRQQLIETFGEAKLANTDTFTSVATGLALKALENS